MKKKYFYFLMVFSLLLLNSCGSSKVLETQNSSDGTKIEKAYVYVDGGTTKTGGTISIVIKEILNSYNIDNYVHLYRDLDLKTDEEIKQSINKYNASHLIYVKLISHQTYYQDKGGSSEKYIYLLNVSNTNTQKTVWKSTFSVSVSGFQEPKPYIKKSLTEIFAKMKSDGIIK